MTEKNSERRNTGFEPGTPIIVTTEHRGVFFGYFAEADGDQCTITRARNCIYWPAETRGFLGLAIAGPLDGARIGPAADRLQLFDVTAIALVSPEAVQRWELGPWS